ncbi:MAG: calcium/sodium antiporter [Cellulophaga sp.]|uniref:calcium/sodium antiporter n=1 Tax=unclassified Cellulophaga TaxID=2634405 RepID=UPI0026E43134|nr:MULTISPECIES: calcium/sodium antiporter [unclassified Cellulophaga]MDO6492456.1 calcium/sodium antiporter [Cellulophaga sp. 2_MG-2023]MDO6496044.1 calcium/sodium antiporter [Cellulophaga sp. 3_MG-2023]
MLNIVYIIIGLVFLIMGGNWLLKSSVALSLRLQIPKIVVGMTVVSFATSAPELIVSIKAALDGSPDLSLGNVVGSNIANLGLVLGFIILLGSINVRKSFYTTDWPILMFASLLFFGFIYFDGVIVFYEGLVMVALLIIYIVYLIKFQKTAVEDEAPEDDMPLPTFKMILFLVLGGLGLWGGSELLVSGATGLARFYNVSERVIGVTVVSIGTSIPELAASIIAVIKKEKAISLGNLIGSNIFNIFAVLGITAMITPLKVVDQTLLSNDILWMLGFALVLLPLVFIPKGLRLGWRDGIVLLAGYATFIYFTI